MRPEGVGKTLLIMRHGETSWNRERRIMGAADVSLNDAGRDQCRSAARLLAAFKIDRIVSSPLERARGSAEIIASVLGLDVAEDSDLSEVRFGRWQGMTYDEVMCDPEYENYARDPCRTATPGGETMLDVQSRALVALGRAESGARTLFVSHGDIIRSALCHFLAVPTAEYRRLRVDNCGIAGVLAHDGYSEVKFVNMLADPERVFESLHWGPAK